MEIRSHPLAEEIATAMAVVAGDHPGHRLAHAKGMLCAGSFTATRAASALTTAAHLQGEEVRAHIRFSNGGGNPTKPDYGRDGRGMAVKLYLPDGSTTDIVAITPNIFMVRTAEDFLTLVKLRAPDPETGEPDYEALQKFLEAHPETQRGAAAALAAGPPESYLTVRYHALHSYLFTAADGSQRYGRYIWEPEAGIAHLEDEDAKARGADYLQADLAERLALAPAAFTLKIQLADEGDAVDDPTEAWPEERETIEAGRLEITGPAFDRDRDGDVLVFDPNRVTPGIESSGDQILAARSAAYSVSVARRTA